MVFEIQFIGQRPLNHVGDAVASPPLFRLKGSPKCVGNSTLKLMMVEGHKTMPGL